MGVTFNNSSAVPQDLRRELERMLWSDLPRFQASVVIIAVSQLLRELEPDELLRLPDVPLVASDSDGSLMIVSAGEVPEGSEPPIPIPTSVARSIERLANAADLESREDSRWDLDILLRADIENLLLYEEMMFGHLVLAHGEDPKLLMARAAEDWFEIHRTCHS
jgi:hypothetical protein